MDNSKYFIRISPGVIKGDIFTVTYKEGSYVVPDEVNICCPSSGTGTTFVTSGTATVYSSMTQVLSGGTNGTSLLTGLTIPILITENINDVGYYTPTDGYLLQKDVINNFIDRKSTRLNSSH